MPPSGPGPVPGHLSLPDSRPAGYRACDDELLICRGTIYAIPIWEIDADTGMIILYAADPATGQLILGPDHHLIPVGQVPAAGLARPDARPHVVWDYVGQTIRELAVRAGEHTENQCWADLIIGQPVIIEQGMWDKKVRDGKEIGAIADLKPRFNRQHNEHNDRRIEIWRQVELRRARDQALGRQPWLPLEQRMRAVDPAIAGPALQELRPPMEVVLDVLLWGYRQVASWRPVARLALLVVVTWMTATTAGGYALLRWGWPPAYAWLISVSVNLAVGLSICRPDPRRRRRRRRH